MLSTLTWRQNVQPFDSENVRELVASTQVFSVEEIRVAGELVEDCLQKGATSEYRFLFIEESERLIGYTCFGLIPFTDQRYDIYWIAVVPQYQQQGLGKELLQKTEEIISQMGGKIIYMETSSRDIYLPTRNFYSRNGYQKIAELENFYRDGDNKIIYSKK